MQQSAKPKMDLLSLPKSIRQRILRGTGLVQSNTIDWLATQASHPVALHGNALPGIPADTVSVYLYLGRC